MPAIVTLGGIALAVVGILIALAGLPDRSAGLGLGSDLVQAGASIFAGGLVIAALGQVLKALRDVADRVDEAVFGLSSSRQPAVGELSQNAPMPLPRASARNMPLSPQPELEEAFPPREVRGEQRTQRSQPAQRTARPPAVEPQQRQAARTQAPRPVPQPEEIYDAPQTDDDFSDDFGPAQHESRQEPRWMRAQNEPSEPRQSAPVQPQPRRSNRATPVAPQGAVRREQAPAPELASYEVEPRRRAAQPQPDDLDLSEPTVVRSGIIAGMAYTLYSDRSIEAELPAGTVRFGSIQELQEHVKRAGVEDQDDYRGPGGAPH